MLSRPKVTEELLEQIRQVIEDNPDWGRTRISNHLCELWDWRIPGGTYKEISCRDMLRALDKAGKIQLPAPKRSPVIWGPIQHKEHNTDPIVCELGNLRPLCIDVVEGGAGLTEFKSLIDQYHYLGFGRTIGENMKYIVRSNTGAVLACLLFGAAAWSCYDRDEYIGWDSQQRTKNLQMLTNNVRFLVVPWVQVPHLASHILSLIASRLSADWQVKYGHHIMCLETFVEIKRFRAVCYRAANWINVGRTVGRGRGDRLHTAALPEKDIYLLPLNRHWREALLGQG